MKDEFRTAWKVIFWLILACALAVGVFFSPGCAHPEKIPPAIHQIQIKGFDLCVAKCDPLEAFLMESMTSYKCFCGNQFAQIDPYGPEKKQ